MSAVKVEVVTIITIINLNVLQKLRGDKPVYTALMTVTMA